MRVTKSSSPGKISASIREAIRDFTPASSRRGSGVELDVELLDIVLENSSKIGLLVSYAGVDNDNSVFVGYVNY